MPLAPLPFAAFLVVVEPTMGTGSPVKYAIHGTGHDCRRAIDRLGSRVVLEALLGHEDCTLRNEARARDHAAAYGPGDRPKVLPAIDFAARYPHAPPVPVPRGLPSSICPDPAQQPPRRRRRAP